MKLNNAKSALLVGVILTLFALSSVAINPVKTDAAAPFFTLVAKTNGGGTRPDYLNFLAQHVARIGINVDVIVQDWPTFVNELMVLRDFDVCYVALTGGGADPDFTGVYDENGSLNLFGYDETMDWDENLTIGARTGWGLNEWYMMQGTLIMPPDSEERVFHYWEWEQYLMDKILPCQPTFAPKAYIALWENLDGYNYSDGVIQSWGKMGFTGTHTGQTDNTELVITDAAWSDLNPLFQDDTSSSFISGACLEPLIYYDQDLSVWPHVAKWYKMENETTFVVNIRQGMKWQPDPENAFPDEEVTIEDVYFTFYAWATVSNDPGLFEWIDDMEIVNSTCMKIYIDGDPSTPENEPYAPFLPSCSVNILPEHYLNQTQLPDGKTPDITDPSWNTYATHCFGSGILEFGTFVEGVETTMTVFDDCWMLDPTMTADPALDFERRFGDFTGGLETLRIRIIPDIQTALLEFEAGKVDIVGVTGYPDKRAQYISDPTKKIQSDTQFYFGFFGYNMREVRPDIGNRDACPGDPTISKGLAIRKAISYALDRVEINNVVHQGEYTITDHPIYLKMGIWCNPNIIRYNHDLDKAKEYMIKAGYTFPTATIPTYTTTTAPGFGLWMALASIVALATTSIVVLKRRQ